jgi:hypothetical protein
VHGPGTTEWLHKCDSSLVGAIKHAASSLLMLSHSAVSLTLHFTLPSILEAAVKVSELFLRMNSTACRWGSLGRSLLREALPAVMDASSVTPRPDSGSRMERAVTLAVKALGWRLELYEEPREGGRHQP